MIIYLLTFYLFDDIEIKYRDHSCESFCYAKGNFDKSARLHVKNLNVYIIFFLRFALGIIYSDRVVTEKHQNQLFYSSKPPFFGR